VRTVFRSNVRGARKKLEESIERFEKGGTTRECIMEKLVPITTMKGADYSVPFTSETDEGRRLRLLQTGVDGTIIKSRNCPLQ
jgi:hypothetical protein